MAENQAVGCSGGYSGGMGSSAKDALMLIEQARNVNSDSSQCVSMDSKLEFFKEEQKNNFSSSCIGQIE